MIGSRTKFAAAVLACVCLVENAICLAQTDPLLVFAGGGGPHFASPSDPAVTSGEIARQYAFFNRRAD